jgi:hypothetical protein
LASAVSEFVPGSNAMSWTSLLNAFGSTVALFMVSVLPYAPLLWSVRLTSAFVMFMVDGTL